MTRAKHRANRFRWIILVVGILYSLVAIGWLLLPFFGNLIPDFDYATGALCVPFFPPFDMGNPSVSNSIGMGLHGCLMIGVVLLTQWTLLKPGRAFGARLTIHARPMKRSVIVAALMAMLLTVGAIALVMEIPDWWEKLLDRPWMNGWIIWGAMLAMWIMWTIIFWIYWRQGDRYTQLGKMIRALMAGSLIEAVIAIPVHVWVMRQRDCYCARGSYTTLVLSGTVLFWAFGPGIVLLFMREKYRQVKLFPMCTNCGYDMRGSGEICPECGTIREQHQGKPTDLSETP